MKRRNFLLLAGAGTAAVALPLFNYYLGDIEYPDSLTHPRALTSICEAETLRHIGELYRSQVPAEDSERKLARTLMKDLSAKSETFAGDLAQKIQQDFEAYQTVMVDGWVLSATEARQCALLSLSTSP